VKLHDDANETSQAVCWTTQAGHLWMRDYYDRLPAAIRRRLRESPHNVCPACLIVYFLPVVQKKHPRLPYEKQLLVAIAIMEKLAEEAYQKKTSRRLTRR
jgi:hypothetical protein